MCTTLWNKWIPCQKQQQEKHQRLFSVCFCDTAARKMTLCDRWRYRGRRRYRGMQQVADLPERLAGICCPESRQKAMDRLVFEECELCKEEKQQAVAASDKAD